MLLRTNNALTWVIDGDEDYSGGTLLLAYRAPDVLAGQTPCLGESFLQVVFINPAPAMPMPDLMQLLYAPVEGQSFRILSFRGQAQGELHESFGVREGTRGRVTVVQTGLWMTAAKGAVSDLFPAEMVHLQALGQ